MTYTAALAYSSQAAQADTAASQAAVNAAAATTIPVALSLIHI